MPISDTGQHGFSLIEALVALTLLTVGFLALGQFQSAAIQGNAQVRNRSLALSLAEARLETLRGEEDYTELAPGSNTVTGPNAEFDVVWNVNGLVNPERQKLTVTVAWITSEGRARQVQLSSWVAPNPLIDVGLVPTP